ncbi:ABC-three component system protein [Flavobacterium eburneipallidum]|uniref:ABC-three component system protein n=1 Tax=Flavobacterium eburneipallidum TaxID=3003263 RepID=UPI002482A646|nr:ABC-three component system protein [Flavobacterium eburneipallidum]
MQKITNDSVDRQINVAENSGNIYMSKKSKYTRLFEKLNIEVSSNKERFAKVLQEMERYLTKKDSIGLKQKLIDGGFSKRQIIRALERKQLYWKKYEKYKNYEFAQRIHIDLLAKIIIDFETHVEPLIIAEQDQQIVLECIYENVVKPMLTLLNDEGAEDEVLYLNSEEVYGMIFFLTGKCHLNWKDYDSI